MAEAESALKRTLAVLPRAPFHVPHVEIIGIYQKLLKRDIFPHLQSGRYISFDHTAWAATSSSGIESGGSKVSNRSDPLPSVPFSEGLLFCDRDLRALMQVTELENNLLHFFRSLWGPQPQSFSCPSRKLHPQLYTYLDLSHPLTIYHESRQRLSLFLDLESVLLPVRFVQALCRIQSQ